MFEDRAPALFEEMRDASRVENRAVARRLVKVGELYEMRRIDNGEAADYAVDTCAEVAAEVAAALRVSVSMAESFLDYARAMRERLPRVAEVFVAGDIDFRTFKTIVYRTDLVVDEQQLAAVDKSLAVRAPRWGSMSRSRLNAAIDLVVACADQDAVRGKAERGDGRGVVFWGLAGDRAGMAATLWKTDAYVLEDRLDALAATVCADDPRTEDERRADALTAMAVGGERLSCRCGSAQCPAGGRLPSPLDVTVHVVAEQSSVDGRADAPGYLVEAGELISAELVAELAREAAIRPLFDPIGAPAEPGYAPSRRLADYVRCRDLTCRAPGCDRPAVDCDIDHTIAYGDGGLTHASNLKCLCRFHHLLKTFWSWRDKQLADGTVIWTLPGGQNYVTMPGSALIFPTLCVPTGDLPAPHPTKADQCGDPRAMMPRRKSTRAENHAKYVAAERARNHKLGEARRKHWEAAYYGTPSSPDADEEPPPF